MVQFIGSCQPNVIVGEALSVLGLSFEEFRDIAELRHQTIDELTSDQVSADEWIRICSLLHLNVDVYTSGFDRRELARGITTALKTGKLKIRVTSKIKELVLEENTLAANFT